MSVLGAFVVLDASPTTNPDDPQMPSVVAVRSFLADARECALDAMLNGARFVQIARIVWAGESME